MTGIDLLLAAMMIVESGGDPTAVGDGGRSVGVLQISRAYFDDAIWQLKREGKVANYRYPEDVRDPRIARTIVLAYWRRWAADALAAEDFETLARVHNGGPRGALKHATLKYWARVEVEMKKGAERETISGKGEHDADRGDILSGGERDQTGRFPVASGRTGSRA